MSMWLVVALEEQTWWVNSERHVSFRGRELSLIPETEQNFPCIFLEYDTANEDDASALKIVREFLSDLSWTTGHPVRESQYYSRSGYGVAVDKRSTSQARSASVPLDYLLDPAEPEKRLALGLYREAINSQNPYHCFLNFFRILNIGQGKGAQQIQWINNALPRLSDHHALCRMNELKSQGITDIGQYLYASGRCAVAHAAQINQTVNPDDPGDSLRIHFDIPIIKHLSEIRIESDFGLKRRDTALREYPFALEHPENILCPVNAKLAAP